MPNPEPRPPGLWRPGSWPTGSCSAGRPPADRDDLVELYETAFGEQDGPDVRAFLADPRILEAWSVVCDGSKIASAIGRIDHRMQLDGLEFVTAQIEYVATDDAYQRRGLVAAQMAWHHDACLEAGIDVQMIGGIPYFYRRFGYGYGLEDCALFLFDRARVDAVPAVAHTGPARDRRRSRRDPSPRRGAPDLRLARRSRRPIVATRAQHVRRQRLGRHLRRRG